MNRVEIYKCENCGNMTRTKSVQCISCGEINSAEIIYKTTCCNVIIHKKEIWCPQCGERIE